MKTNIKTQSNEKAIGWLKGLRTEVGKLEEKVDRALKHYPEQPKQALDDIKASIQQCARIGSEMVRVRDTFIV